MKRNVVLADCESKEISSFIDGLNISGYKFVCEFEIANGIRTGIISEIKRYFAYFRMAWHAFTRRNEYNIIVGWQQFYVLIFCFYCSLFHVKKENMTVALNFTYKEKSGLVGRVYKKFMNKCISNEYLDYIHVLSNEYADYVNSELKFPRDRIIVTTFGIDDIFSKWKDSAPQNGYTRNGYAMSIGRSNRDYDFLVNAWKNIDFPLVIISDSYTTKSELPSNIKLITNVTGNDQYPWVANAKIVIIPIKDEKICSGDTVLVTALSFEKIVIVTSPSTLGEMYIEDRKNGYLVTKNQTEFCELVNHLLVDNGGDLGTEARKSFLEKFSRYSMGQRIADAIS